MATIKLHKLDRLHKKGGGVCLYIRNDIKGHRQRIFLLAIFVHVGYLNKDMYFIWNENYSIRSKKRMKLV